MNVQIFIDGQDKPVSIDMESVCAIRFVYANIIIIGDGKKWKQGSHVRQRIDKSTSDENDKSPFYVINANLLMKHGVGYDVWVELTPKELWDAMGADPNDENGNPWDEDSMRSGIFENFTDDEALRIMTRYWKDMADTPLTKQMLGENRFRVPQNKETHEPKEEDPDDPNVCKKLLCSLVKHDGTLIWDEIVYPGYAEDMESDEFLEMMDALDFARCDDKDHNDLIVTDDIVCLAERMTEEWEGEYRGESACEYVAHVLDAMVGGQLKADEIIIDGRMFNAAEGQRIYVSRYTKDIVYDGRTQEYLKKIGKELKK